MDNLINFEDFDKNFTKNGISHSRIMEPIRAAPHQLLVPITESQDQNNPFDTLEFRIENTLDPFECVGTAQIKTDANGSLIDGSL